MLMTAVLITSGQCAAQTCGAGLTPAGPILVWPLRAAVPAARASRTGIWRPPARPSASGPALVLTWMAGAVPACVHALLAGLLRRAGAPAQARPGAGAR